MPLCGSTKASAMRLEWITFSLFLNKDNCCSDVWLGVLVMLLVCTPLWRQKIHPGTSINNCSGWLKKMTDICFICYMTQQIINLFTYDNRFMGIIFCFLPFVFCLDVIETSVIIFISLHQFLLSDICVVRHEVVLSVTWEPEIPPSSSP